MLAAVPPIAVLAASSAAIIGLTALGVVQRTVRPAWSAANLDSEVSVGMWFSAALLWTTAAVWAVVAAARHTTGWAWAWSAVVTLLALDEGNAVHERLERWSGVDWQLLYLPVLAAGAIAWWFLLRALPARPARPVLAGAMAWGAALGLELIQNWGGEPIRASLYDPMMIAEEALEMAGAALFLVGGLLILRSTRRPV